MNQQQLWTVVVRAGLLWAAVTGVTAVVVGTCLPAAAAMVRSPGADFTTLLVQLCAVVGTAAAIALWLTTTGVVREVAGPGAAAGPTERPGVVRTALLTICGVAVLSGVSAVGHASLDAPLTARALDGLPLPDRATGRISPGDSGLQHGNVVRVRPGDSLWAIAARALGPDPSVADVASYCRRLHAANAAAIGPDPDLIQPHQQLRLPPAP